VKAYVILFLVDAALSGAWIWAVARWMRLEFPLPDLLITVCLCSALALLPGYGWLLAMFVLWLLLRGVRRADLWPEIIVMSAGSAFIWLAASMSLLI